MPCGKRVRFANGEPSGRESSGESLDKKFQLPLLLKEGKKSRRRSDCENGALLPSTRTTSVATTSTNAWTNRLSDGQMDGRRGERMDIERFSFSVLLVLLRRRRRRRRRRPVSPSALLLLVSFSSPRLSSLMRELVERRSANATKATICPLELVFYSVTTSRLSFRLANEIPFRSAQHACTYYG